MKCGDGPPSSGRTARFAYVTLLWLPPSHDYPVGSGFSRLEATLRMENNNCERPFVFPSSRRVHVTPTSSKTTALLFTEPFLHDYNVKVPNFAFYVERKQAMTKLAFDKVSG